VWTSQLDQGNACGSDGRISLVEAAEAWSGPWGVVAGARRMKWPIAKLSMQFVSLQTNLRRRSRTHMPDRVDATSILTETSGYLQKEHKTWSFRCTGLLRDGLRTSNSHGHAIRRSLTDRGRSDYVHHHLGAVCIFAGLCVSSVYVVESLAEIANVCGVSPYSSKSGNACCTS
jgi:hypothetical protein